MQKTYCDRCHKDTSSNLHTKVCVNYLWDVAIFDLCSKCEKEFKKCVSDFMKKENN